MRIPVSKATQRAIARNIHRQEVEERAAGGWERRKSPWPWRDYLTADEKATLERADRAKADWLALNKERAGITNRAIQRAKYALKTAEGD